MVTRPNCLLLTSYNHLHDFSQDWRSEGSTYPVQLGAHMVKVGDMVVLVCVSHHLVVDLLNGSAGVIQDLVDHPLSQQAGGDDSFVVCMFVLLRSQDVDLWIVLVDVKRSRLQICFARLPATAPVDFAALLLVFVESVPVVDENFPSSVACHYKGHHPRGQNRSLSYRLVSSVARTILYNRLEVELGGTTNSKWLILHLLDFIYTRQH